MGWNHGLKPNLLLNWVSCPVEAQCRYPFFPSVFWTLPLCDQMGGGLDQTGVPVPSFPGYTDNLNVSTFYIKISTILVGVNTINRHWVHERSFGNGPLTSLLSLFIKGFLDLSYRCVSQLRPGPNFSPKKNLLYRPETPPQQPPIFDCD
jgi:hypothetical protein